MKASKLVHSVASVKFVDYVFRTETNVKEFKNVPFLTWPDGNPCPEANLYIISLLQRNLSTSGGGGSIGQYAYVISRLMRFCFEGRLRLQHLTDAQFVKFVESLRSPNTRGRRPTQNTIISNGRVVLGFLAYLEDFFGGLSLLGENGRIKAFRKKTTSSYNGKKVEREIWDHSSFGSPSPLRRRSPIAKDTIDSLNRAAASVSKSSFLIHRRQILIRVLEMTGARVGEVALLKSADILETFRRNRRFLTFYTLKRRAEHKRDIPVLKQDLADLVNFIEVSRRSVIRRSKWRNKDHGSLFISEKSGSPLTAATLSNEIGKLRRHSGMTTKASAHLFRHRFITRMLIQLIEEYKFQNESDFRSALLEIEGFKKVLTEWTGHASPASLDPYIDLAFAEWRGLKNMVEGVFRRRAAEGFAERVDMLVGDLGQNLSPDEFRASYAALRKNLLEPPLEDVL